MPAAAEYCNACGNPAEDTDRYGRRAWCAPCWEAAKFKTLSWLHDAVSRQVKPGKKTEES